LEIKLEGIVIIVGNYGSGKSEVSINLAAKKKHEGADVRIADLDLVNPYFRTREARRALTKLGIGVVLPPQRYLQSMLVVMMSGLPCWPAWRILLKIGLILCFRLSIRCDPLQIA
jgi:Mrp family chromosome partitioning ATPase